MERKRIWWAALLGSLLMSSGLHAQTNYYQGQDTLYCNGFTYLVINEYDMFYRLRNITNVNLPQPPKYLDGTLIPALSLRHLYVQVNDPDNQLLYALVRETFTPTELAAWKTSDERLIIQYGVNIDGSVGEVEFEIEMDNPTMCAIPPEKFHALEEKIKQQITFTVPDDYNNIQYIPMMFFLQFEDL